MSVNPTLKVDPHTKNQGQRPNSSAGRAHANGHTDGRTDTWTLPSALHWAGHRIPEPFVHLVLVQDFAT